LAQKFYNGKNFSDAINSEFNQNLENFNQNTNTSTIINENFSYTKNFSDSNYVQHSNNKKFLIYENFNSKNDQNFIIRCR